MLHSKDRAGNLFRRMPENYSMAMVVLLLWAALPLQGNAQLGIVHGRVLDSSGTPVTEATVSARNETTGSRQSALTGAGGVFEIFWLVPGVYEIEAEQAENGNARLL